MERLYLIRVLIIPGEDTVGELEVTLFALLFQPTALPMGY